MKILITGITGFIGSHLAERLLQQDTVTSGIEIHGMCRWRSPRDNLINIHNKIHLHEADLLDLGSLIELIQEVEPEQIYHLAAQSYVKTSYSAPIATLWTNVIGTANLLEAITFTGQKPRILAITSSEVYGQVTAEDIPITEDCPLRPHSPYGVSKVGQDMTIYQYTVTHNLDTVRIRNFTTSVSEFTPVIIRDSKTGIINIKYISEIRKAKERDGDCIWNLENENLEVWANNKFTKILHVSAHTIKKPNKMLRIISPEGLIETTDNHSIIGTDMKEIEAGKLNVGDSVKHVEMPSCDSITFINPEIAWLMGLFVAEGDLVDDNRNRVRISNKDVFLLEKAKQILLKYYAKESFIYKEKNNCYRLYIAKSKKFPIFNRNDFYTRDSKKRIPLIILNAQKEAKLEFLKGYNCGDGRKAPMCNYEFVEFCTNSRVLAMGLILLVQQTTGQSFNINYRPKNGNQNDRFIIWFRSPRNLNWKKISENSIKKIMIDESYNSHVYDFETEEHIFHGGIGKNLLHNTGPRRGEVFFMSAFTKQIAAILLGRQEPTIRVGNLDSVRTVCDVRDMVKAYILACNNGSSGSVYNIGGVETHSVGDYLQMMIDLYFPKNGGSRPFVRIDHDLYRPTDVTLQIPCMDRFKFDISSKWKPKIPIDKTIRDMVEYWKNELIKNPWKLNSVVEG